VSDVQYVHVLPNMDAIEHECNEECACGPDAEFVGDDTILYLHHSLDGRELSEPEDWHREEVDGEETA